MIVLICIFEHVGHLMTDSTTANLAVERGQPLQQRLDRRRRRRLGARTHLLLAMAGRVICMPPCLFCMDNH
jgi:hypothetical protein